MLTTHSCTLVWKIPWTEEPGGLHGVAKSWTRLKQLSTQGGGRKKEEEEDLGTCFSMSLVLG